MKFTVDSVIAGKKTPQGNIYPENVLRKAVEEFNDRAQKEDILGGIMNRDILSLEKATHVIRGAKMEDKTVIFDCETVDTPLGLKLEDTLKSGAEIDIFPVIIAGLDQPHEINGDKVITEIHHIKSVGISCIEEIDDEHKRSDHSGSEGEQRICDSGGRGKPSVQNRSGRPSGDGGSVNGAGHFDHQPGQE